MAEAGQSREFEELPAPWLDYARSHLMYEQVHADLNVKPQGVVYPNLYNFADLLSVGRQPRYLVDALLDRRFDAVKPIGFASPQELLFWEIYASGNGREESSYIWKLNQVIESGYAPAPGLPEGFLARRAGPAAGSLDGRLLRSLRRRGARVRDPRRRRVLVPGRGGGPRAPAHARGGHRAARHREGRRPVREPRRDPAARAASSCASAGRATRSGSCAAPAPPGASASGAHRCPAGRGEPITLAFGAGDGEIRVEGTRVNVPAPRLDSSHFSIYATRGSGARFDLGDLSGS